MVIILVTNDDGIDAVGLKELVRALSSLAKVLVVAPRVQRSGESKSLTFSNPLRLNEINDYLHDDASNDNIIAYSVDGTPADCVLMGKFLSNKLFNQDPNIVVAGINAGDNTSIHALLTSGTCAAAFEGSLLGIPSIAFSLEVHPTEFFSGNNNSTTNYIKAAGRAQEIVKFILNNPLPEDINFLNVNFPSSVEETTPIEITKLCPKKYVNDVFEDRDPRKVPIYWIWGETYNELPKNTDSYAILVKKVISITPISLNFGQWTIPSLIDYFNNKRSPFELINA